MTLVVVSTGQGLRCWRSTETLLGSHRNPKTLAYGIRTGLAVSGFASEPETADCVALSVDSVLREAAGDNAPVTVGWRRSYRLRWGLAVLGLCCFGLRLGGTRWRLGMRHRLATACTQ